LIGAFRCQEVVGLWWRTERSALQKTASHRRGGKFRTALVAGEAGATKFASRDSGADHDASPSPCQRDGMPPQTKHSGCRGHPTPKQTNRASPPKASRSSNLENLPNPPPSALCRPEVFPASPATNSKPYHNLDQDLGAQAIQEPQNRHDACSNC